MDMERIKPSGLARPSGFSHAVSVAGGTAGGGAAASRMVFLAGQTGVDRDGNVGAISTAADTFYVFQTLGMPEPAERARARVPLC